MTSGAVQADGVAENGGLSRHAGAMLSLALAVGVAVFWIATLREGHNWDGDYALYIMHAENIATGRPYGTTQYIYNPQNWIHPAAYPPGLPLLLAPVYRLAGLDLQRMKLVGVLSFALFLLVFGRTARRHLPLPLAVALIATIGFHPWIWGFKDTIFSELPFMLFCYATLDLTDRMAEQPLKRSWGAILASAFALALACLTRSIGVALFPAILLVYCWRTRKLINAGTLTLLGGLLLIGLSRLAFPYDAGTYVNQFAAGGGTPLLSGLQNYGSAVKDLLGVRNLHGSGLRTLLMAAFLIVMFVGFAARARARLAVFELFFVLYWVALLTYPFQVEVSRYSLPVWPLMLFYAFTGVYQLGTRAGAAARIAAPALLVAGLWLLQVAQYRRADFGPIPFSVTADHSREVFEVMKTRLPPDAVVLTRKPAIIALFTDRRAAVWPAPFREESAWAYARQIGASYVLQGPLDYGLNGSRPDDFDAFIARNQARLHLIFTNPWFRLYQVTVPPKPDGRG
ncbi:MAG TPA: hypothetical protein VJQ44_04320 [Gemmatimonadales bacterium]|nr:hypothetical protein [Gemmatimonadales bacterium]